MDRGFGKSANEEGRDGKRRRRRIRRRNHHNWRSPSDYLSVVDPKQHVSIYSLDTDKY
jgi:hypothetical protein